MKVNLLIDNYLKHCKWHSNLNENTLKAYKIDLLQFYNFAKNEQEIFSKDLINDYIYYLRKEEYAIKSVKRKIASLKAFLSYLNYENILNFNPFYQIKSRIKEPFVLPKTISVKELELLFEHLYKKMKKFNKDSYRYKEVVRDIAVVELLIGTGIRISELCDLKKENLNIGKGRLKIYGKGARERILPIYCPSIVKALKMYQDMFERELIYSKYFFINKRRGKLSSQSVRNMLKKCCKELELNIDITPHMFRHTFATMLLEEDVDIRYIQGLLGHSNIMTTQIYTHVTSKKKSEIMKYKNPRSRIGVDNKKTSN